LRRRAYLENLGYEVAFGPDVAPVSFYPPLRVADLSAVGGFSFGPEGRFIRHSVWRVYPTEAESSQPVSVVIF